jgi:glycosyltransferase involved in cell wall biosynthesis
VKVFAIIPVYNEERHIGRCLTRLGEFIEGIVVLDDGSTDRTAEILAQYPKVLKILRTPASAKHNWHDARNHIRLNRALAEFKPDWVIRIDADETFDDAMKTHLPKLANAAPEIRAFAFRRHLFDQAEGKCSACWLDIVRMYRYSPQSRFATRRLHVQFQPIDITNFQIRMTNIRLWHHTGYTQQLREERYEKFARTDPFCLYQGTYENLLSKPDFVAVPPVGDNIELSPWVESSSKAPHPLWQSGREWLRTASHFLNSQLSRLRKNS